ncbi:MAG TPA: ubiquitin-like small modifier protein 1 [Thermoanaerobaculia bacterium]|nr:ubiquitin-like small modifier protein 1 [Thermoanaerobaculia bacterium]
MSVTVHVPAALRQHGEGPAEVVLEVGPQGAAGTVGGVLAALFAAHPALRDRLVGETGQLREHVNLFVGNENVRYTGGFATPVADGAELTILPAVSGG